MTDGTTTTIPMGSGVTEDYSGLYGICPTSIGDTTNRAYTWAELKEANLLELSAPITAGVYEMLGSVGGPSWDTKVNAIPEAQRTYLTLIISDTITILHGSKDFNGIFSLSNYTNKLDQVQLPASIKSIRVNAFKNYSGEIAYHGTVDAFTNIPKADGWAHGCNTTEVMCLDGNYTITTADKTPLT